MSEDQVATPSRSPVRSGAPAARCPQFGFRLDPCPVAYLSARSSLDCRSDPVARGLDEPPPAGQPRAARPGVCPGLLSITTVPSPNTSLSSRTGSTLPPPLIQWAKFALSVPWGAADVARARNLAVELVARAPEVILASASPAVTGLQEVTRTVPIVFVNVIDPVGAGFVASLSRPGGNTTGFTIFEYSISGKWLEILKQIAPRVSTMQRVV
jgi:hypothetical protein